MSWESKVYVTASNPPPGQLRPVDGAIPDVSGNMPMLSDQGLGVNVYIAGGTGPGGAVPITGTITVTNEMSGTIDVTGTVSISGVLPLSGTLPVTVTGTVSLDSGSIQNINTLFVNVQEAPAAETGSLYQFAYTTSSFQILPANPNRKSFSVYNYTTTPFFLAPVSGVSSSSFAVRIVENGYYETTEPMFLGGIWGVNAPGGSGTIQVAEYTGDIIPANTGVFNINVNSFVAVNDNPAFTGSVTAFTSSVTPFRIITLNDYHKAYTVYNATDVNAYISPRNTVSTSSFMVKIVPGGYFETTEPTYIGDVWAVSEAAGSGTVQVTEYTGNSVTATSASFDVNISGIVPISGALPITGTITVTNEMSGTVDVTGSVLITNWPAAVTGVNILNHVTASISGVVQVSGTSFIENWPAAVTGVNVLNTASITGSVGITNWPATQSVSFTQPIQISGNLSASITNWPVTQSVSFVQPVEVSGGLTVLGTASITGTVFISNLPATQSVSFTQPVQVSGNLSASISNWPVTQSVSFTQPITASITGTVPVTISGSSNSVIYNTSGLPILVSEDGQRSLAVSDIHVVDILGRILKELQKMNIQLAIVTDDEIENADLD